MYATHRGSMHLWTTIAHPRSQDRLKGLHPLGHQTPRKPKASILGVVEGSGGPALPSNCHKGGVEGANFDSQRGQNWLHAKQAQASKIMYFCRLAG